MLLNTDQSCQMCHLYYVINIAQVTSPDLQYAETAYAQSEQSAVASLGLTAPHVAVRHLQCAVGKAHM